MGVGPGGLEQGTPGFCPQLQDIHVGVPTCIIHPSCSEAAGPFSMLSHFCPSQVGYDLKEEIERKFDKWQEPPPVKQVKPLPAPLDGQRKKRGGRRSESDLAGLRSGDRSGAFPLCGTSILIWSEDWAAG